MRRWRSSLTFDRRRWLLSFSTLSETIRLIVFNALFWSVRRCIRYKYVSISHLGLICSQYLLQYILSALCIIFFLNGSSQNGLRRRIALPARTAATRWRYNRKKPTAKRIRQEVKEMQANPSDDFMSLPLEVYHHTVLPLRFWERCLIESIL